MARRSPPAAPGVPEWVLTYGDLMSLLLCFFILLAAFSELKRPEEYRQIVQAIREAFGFTGGPGSMPLNDDSGGSASSVLNLLRESLGENLSEDNIPRPDVTGNEERSALVQPGARFAVGGSLLFHPASTELTDDVKEQLRTQIAPAIRDQRYKVEIRGHAWGVEDRLEGSDYLDLSYRRARAVMDFLVRECGVDPRILLLVAAADTEPHSVVRYQNGANAANRRVQVIRTEVLVDDVHPDPHWTGRP